MHYIFVPGAWHGGWAWNPVAQRVRDAGHTAVCLTLPGMGDGDDRAGVRLRDATQHIVAAARTSTDDVVLVGHSLGGLMIAAAAADLGSVVHGLVFVDAFVPAPGQSMNEANPAETRGYVDAQIDGSTDGVVDVPGFDLAKSALMHELPDAAAHLIHQMLTPTPGGYFRDAYPGPSVESMGMELGYLLAEDDRGLAVPGPEMAKRLGVDPVSVPGNHEALLTHPDEVADAILGLALDRSGGH
jgi:pimeloyl-ACP methyl ester carboxylesterase